MKARDGIEAQYGLNDVWPGDEYPDPQHKPTLETIRMRQVQALGAAISRRDWHATESAYNDLRDRFDDLLRHEKARIASALALAERIKQEVGG